MIHLGLFDRWAYWISFIGIIHYWEKRFDRRLIEHLVKHIGRILDDEIGYEYSIIDSKKFSLWNTDVIEFHILSRKSSVGKGYLECYRIGLEIGLKQC